MKIYEINPYIRFARTLKLSEPGYTVGCYDCRLFYILQGNVKVTVNNTVHKLCENSVLLLPSGTIYNFEPTESLYTISINFDYTQLHREIFEPLSPQGMTEFNKNKILDNINFEDNDTFNYPTIIKSFPEIKNSLKTLIDIFSKKEIYFMEKCSLRLNELLIDILQYSTFSSFSTIDKIEKVISYINENYSDNITNNDLAKIVNYHPYHLNKLMLKYTSFTTHQYLLSLRLEKSKEFLVNKTYTMTEISEKCGFNSEYHFSNSFKKKYGCSPLKYRRLNKNVI